MRGLRYESSHGVRTWCGSDVGLTCAGRVPGACGVGLCTIGTKSTRVRNVLECCTRYMTLQVLQEVSRPS